MRISTIGFNLSARIEPRCLGRDRAVRGLRLEGIAVFDRHRRAGADTQHAVNADILQKLGPQGTIVNISRGSVIDQKALVAALGR